MSFIQELIGRHFANFEESIYNGKFDFYNYIMKIFQDETEDKEFVEKLSADLRAAFQNRQDDGEFFDKFTKLFERVTSTNINRLQQQSIKSAFQKLWGEVKREEAKQKQEVQKKTRKERKDKGVSNYTRKQDTKFFFQTKVELDIERRETMDKKERFKKMQVINVGIQRSLCDENGDIQNEKLAGLLLDYFQRGAVNKNIVVNYVDPNRYIPSRYDRLLNVTVDGKIKVNPDAKLVDIPMKQHFKLVKQFGDTKLLNPNEGQCVVDFLESRYGSGKNSMKKVLKESNLKKIFGENYRVEGVTIEQLARFCDENEIDIYAFNVFNRLIYKKTYEKSHKPLLFHIQNCHLLPIVETSLIQSFVKIGRSQMFDYKFSIVYDDFLYFSEESLQAVMGQIRDLIEKMRMENCKNEFNAKVVLIDDQKYDINQIFHETQILSEYQITDFKFDKENHLLAFRVPDTNLVIESVYDFEKRREDYLHLKRLFPSYFSQFQNQQYCEMGIQMFEMFNSMNKLKSNMNEKLFQFYQSYSRGPYIATVETNQKIIDKCEKIGLDINKSYTNAILNSGYDFNQYNVFDEIVRYDGREIIQGSYFLSKGIVIERIGVIVPPGLFEYPIVQWSLKNGFVKKEDITHMVIPQKMIDCKIFERMVLTTIAAQETDEIDHVETQLLRILCPDKPDIIKKKRYGFAKHMINNFIGCLAKSHHKKVQGTVINNYLEACALFNQMINEGSESSIYQHQNMFFVTSTSKTPSLKNSIPVYRQIIELGMMQLFQLALDSCKDDSRVASFNTDYVAILNPKKINMEEYSVNQNLYEKQEIKLDFLENLMNKYGKIDLNQIGRIKEEDFKTRGSVKESCDQVIPEIEMREFNVIEECQETNDTVKMLSKMSCLVNAGSGVGKTYLCARLTEYLGDQKYLGLCFTNVAVDNLRKQGVKNVQTLDSFFSQHQQEKKLAQNISHVIVDEVSMVNSYHMNLIQQLKKRYGVKLLMFGDFNQCKPVEENCYDYLNNQIFREMVDFNLLKMKYKSVSRFEGQTLEIVNKLLDGYFEFENTSENEFEETDGVDLSVRHHITLTNKRKDKINKMVVEKYFNQYFKEINVSIGMYYMCKENVKDIQLFNGQLFEVSKFEDGKLTLSQYGIDRELILNLNQMNNNLFYKFFEYGFARTIYKIQGITIRERMQIHEGNRMSMNEFYTSITRTTDIKNVLILQYKQFYKKEIREHKYQKQRIDYGSDDRLEVDVTGKIYKIELPNGKVYVGQTTRSVETRLKEHRDSRKTLDDEFHMELRRMTDYQIKKLQIEIVREIAFESIEELNKLEKEIIRQYQNAGRKVLNTVGLQKEKKSQVITGIEKTEKVKQAYYCEYKDHFRIYYFDENGKIKQLKRRFTEFNKDFVLQEVQKIVFNTNNKQKAKE